MTWLPTTALFFVTWLAVFAQTQFRPLAGLLDTPVAVLPALMVYAALTHSLGTVIVLGLLAGVSLDALSPGPIGVSVLPLVCVGFGLHLRRHLILREQVYAQWWLGFGAGIAVPLATLVLLSIGSTRFIAGPFFMMQLLILGLLNGGVCPAVFRTFDAIQNAFDYQPVAQPSFRPDREIKRGRL
ncbi:MAG: hypothetical protein KF791_00640 [Verrucomicrobiae bacterium]|nr:hypothetical protein [Verrucomicrobiae bacterium]